MAKKGMMTGPSMALPPEIPDTMYAGGTPDFDERTGQTTGTTKGGPTKQAPVLTPAITPPRPTGTPIPEITNLPRLEDNDAEPEPEMTFTFFKGAEEGKGNPNYLYEQRGKNDKATVEDLEEYFNAKKSNRLRESFGTFDNYLSYMTEREQLIQSGDYDVGNWAEADAGFTEDQQMIFEGDADLTIDPSDPGQNLQNLRKQQAGAQSGAYNNWLNSDANQALLQKYGVNPEVYSDSGDKFKWNGSAYVKVKDESGTDYVLAGMIAATGYFLGPALSGALGAPASAAGGITAGGIASSAAGNVLSQAIIQGVINGEVDTSTLGQAALAGGLDYIGNAIKAQGLAGIGGDVGAAVDNAIWDMADKLGTDYDTVFNIGASIATGAIQGDDVEDIALNALQTYTTSEIQNLVRTTFANSMGNVDVDNVFREGQTSIPIAALNPLIETAVSGAFGEDIETEDVLDAVYKGLTYSDPFSVDADMTLRSLDPGLNDLDLLGDTPQFIKEIEDAARFVGSEFDDVVIQPVREGGRALDKAVFQPIGQTLSEAETAVRRALPDISLPDGPDIDLPSLPSLGGGLMTGALAGAGGTQKFKKVDPGGITYDPRTQLEMIQTTKQPTALDQITQYLNKKGLFA